MSTLAVLGPSFVLEHLRTRLTLVLLVAIPAFFVLIFASVLGDFATALGGTLAGQAATAISAGWAAAFLSGALAFFEVVSSRGADRRLALAGLGAGRATLLPGYGPGRMMVDGAYSPTFHAAGALVIALAWTIALTLTVGLVLRRAVGTRN